MAFAFLAGAGEAIAATGEGAAVAAGEGAALEGATAAAPMESLGGSYAPKSTRSAHSDGPPQKKRSLAGTLLNGITSMVMPSTDTLAQVDELRH
jgi:hypothetical protein